MKLRQCAMKCGSIYRDLRINVNISYIQMMKSDIWKDILSSIEQYNLPPESLCAELTESGYTDMTPYFYTLRKKFEEKNNTVCSG